MKTWTPALLMLLAIHLPVPSLAHDVDVTGVARVFLDEVDDNAHRYTLSVVDRLVAPLTGVAGVLPSHCIVVSSEARDLSLTTGLTFECKSALVFDDVITLPWRLAGVVALARWSDGTEVSAYFQGDGVTVPMRLGDLQAGAGSSGRLASRYFVLGAEHIVFGIDHLLFVAGLLVLVRGIWPLVKTVTSFTVAHSITLGVAVLDYVPVATAPVEAAIALSIVLLAREIVVRRRDHQHLVHRKPWLVAFVFGLFHGFGFAAALGEIGLRSGDIPLALFFFNAGVEAGQLGFVGALLGLSVVVDRVARSRATTTWVEPSLGYALGTIAMLWLFERLPAVWGT